MATAPISAPDMLELVEQDFFSLREAWHTFKYLFATDKWHVDILNATGPGFFASVQRMMFDDVILRICRLTDPASNRSQENLTLKRVLDATGWKSDDVRRWQEFGARLQSVDAACGACRSHRNKRISHVDLAWSRQALTLPEATLGIVNRAVDAIQDFVEAIYGALHPDVSRSFDIPGIGRDAERLVERLANRASQKDGNEVVTIRYTPGQQPHAELECPLCGTTEWVSFYPKHDPIHRMTTRAHFDGCHGVIGCETINVVALDRTGAARPIEFSIDLAVATRETDADL